MYPFIRLGNTKGTIIRFLIVKHHYLFFQIQRRRMVRLYSASAGEALSLLASSMCLAKSRACAKQIGEH